MAKMVKLGTVDVDSGQLVICDPCYIDSSWKDVPFKPEGKKEHPETGEFSYDGCCRATLSEKGGGQLNHAMGHAGAGVATSTGYGDGSYPVYAEVRGGRIMKVVIDFGDTEAEE